MRIGFRIFENNDFIHVRAEAEANRTKPTVEEFIEGIKERYPDFDKYYWRHRPSREEHRDFDRNDITVRFYARFSVPKNGASRVAADVTTARGGFYHGED